MKYIHVYALFLMSVFYTACGQNPAKGTKIIINPETKDSITSHGPTTSVRTIRQGRNGNMWLVSREGIIRYDGKTKSFTNLTNKIGSHNFWDVLEDRHGNVWVATLDSGAYYYDGKSLQNFTTGDGLASNAVFNIYEDKDGIIWFGTRDGASRYDGKSFRNFKMKGGPPPADPNDSSRVRVYHKQPRNVDDYWMINEGGSRVHAILEDKTGKFWFGTWGYANVYDASLPNGEGKTLTTISDKDGNPFTKVNSIIEDKKGNIWIGERAGLWRSDGTTFTRVSWNSVGDIFEDSKGNIWTTSENYSDRGVLSRYDVKSLSDKKPKSTEIKSGDTGIFGISEAPDGSIWFGSVDGVYRYDGKTIEKL